LALAGGIFEIEGNLLSGDEGGYDWVQGAGGTGVLDNVTGDPVQPRTVHKIDLTGNADANRFFTGVKVFQDPTTWQWKNGSSPPKDDIQNGAIHFYKDNGDWWVAVSGDRRSVNGTSYIDFEFLQSSLVANGDGTFSSAGTDGGRTDGDFLLTIELTKGGDQADFFAQIWRELPPGSGNWTYKDTTVAVGTDAFVSANIDSQVVVPYGAFGSTVYDINQFGESAANLTKILGVDECRNVASIFIRTKSSASPTAELKDFIEPFAPDFCLDDIPPTITFCPSDATVECTDPTGPEALGSAEGQDNCPGAVTVTFEDTEIPGNCPQEKTIERVWTVKDICNNVSTCLQTINVVDSQAPVISGVGDDQTINCTETPVFSNPTADDNCDPNPSLSHGDVTTPGACPQEYSITRTWTATDACGNSSSDSQTITVVDDTAPVISGVGDDQTINCTETPVFSNPTADDDCDPDPSLTHGDVTTPGACPQEYSITRTWTATDACGNVSDPVSQTITVVDDTAPVISGVGDDQTINCTETPVFSDPTANDDCDPNPSLSHDDETTPGACPQEYSITRTWTATDACGNVSDPVSQTITVVDDTAPVISGVGDDQTINCTETPVFSNPTANDDCDPNPSLTFDDVFEGVCPITVTRTWTATDACGNTSTASQVITAVDDAPPVITCPSDETIECPAEPLFGEPLVVDNCDPNPTVTSTTDTIPGPTPGSAVYVRTWEAVDICGNAAIPCSQTITVECPLEKACTFTQGFWGNAGGTFNSQGTLDIIEGLLDGSPLVVGVLGERSITIPKASAACIIQRLPAGTTPKALPEGLGDATLNPTTCQTTGGLTLPMDQYKRFQNVLLGQTIALSLNVRVDTDLPGIPLSETFCTQAALAGPDGLFNTFDDVVDPNAPVLQFSIPSSVITALANLGLPNTVAGLLELANWALAGLNTDVASIPDVNMAVDAINRGFDRCRFLVPCTSAAVATMSKTYRGGGLEGPQLSENEQPIEQSGSNLPIAFELGQNYPNPFNPNTTITLSVPEATNWSLAIFNVAGHLVKRFEGRTSGAAFVTVEWDARDRAGRRVSTGVYFYRVEAGSFNSVKKMVLLK
jgi:hypothetical protein